MTSSNGNIFRVTGPLCGNSPVPGEFPAQRPVTRSFDVFFDLRLNKRLSKQSWGWWFETPSRPLWRYCNVRFICKNYLQEYRITGALPFMKYPLLKENRCTIIQISLDCAPWAKRQHWLMQWLGVSEMSPGAPLVITRKMQRRLIFCLHKAVWMSNVYGSAEGPPRGVENRNLLSHPDDLRMEAYVIRMT